MSCELELRPSRRFLPARAAAWIAGVLLTLAASLRCGPIAVADADAQPKPARFLREWGKQGSEPGEFHFPIGIAIN